MIQQELFRIHLPFITVAFARLIFGLGLYYYHTRICAKNQEKMHKKHGFEHKRHKKGKYMKFKHETAWEK